MTKDIPCPTCGAVGTEQCVRGRKPNGGAGIAGAIWRQGVPFPEGHDSRRTANKTQPMNFDEILELADVIGGRIERGDLPPQDANGFYILP